MASPKRLFIADLGISGNPPLDYISLRSFSIGSPTYTLVYELLTSRDTICSFSSEMVDSKAAIESVAMFAPGNFSKKGDKIY